MVKSGCSSAETLRNACEQFADRPCLGQRAHVLLPNGEKHFLPFYTWVTYERLWQRVVALASGLLAWGVNPRSFVGICGQPPVDPSSETPPARFS